MIRAATLRLRTRKAPPAPAEPAQVPAPAAAAPPKRTPEEVAERIRAAAERDRQAHLEAAQRRQERGRKARAEFRRRWPAAFTTPVPLATGVHELIRAEMPEMTTLRLKEVLGAWMFSVASLRAVAAGVGRINLDGTPAGVPDAEQRALAVEDLGKRGKWPAEGNGQPEGDPAQCDQVRRASVRLRRWRRPAIVEAEALSPVEPGRDFHAVSEFVLEELLALHDALEYPRHLIAIGVAIGGLVPGAEFRAASARIVLVLSSDHVNGQLV